MRWLMIKSSLISEGSFQREVPSALFLRAEEIIILDDPREECTDWVNDSPIFLRLSLGVTRSRASVQFIGANR
jgi:hypothetical protein